MRTCSYCGNPSENIIDFVARRTGRELPICEDCLDGENHDWFMNCILKSKLIEVTEVYAYV